MDSGTLVISTSYPGRPLLFSATTPKVLIDGTDASLTGWGTHTIPVPTGRHRIEVFVPYLFPRRAGKASTEITVGPGEEIELDYVAPATSFARGSLTLRV